MLINDQIKLFLESSLRGENCPISACGSRTLQTFITPELREAARKAAAGWYRPS
jgi:hypothetical protein